MDDRVRLLLIWLGTVSLTALILFGLDKMRAVSGSRRIPEAALLAVSLLGGAAGGLLGMLLFHHKTRKPKFRILTPLFLVIHLALLLFACQS